MDLYVCEVEVEKAGPLLRSGGSRHIPQRGITPPDSSPLAKTPPATGSWPSVAVTLSSFLSTLMSAGLLSYCCSWPHPGNAFRAFLVVSVFGGVVYIKLSVYLRRELQDGL